jgi:hypothetical protein
MTMFRRRNERLQGQPPEVEGEIRQCQPPEIEGEIRELVRRGVPQVRPEPGSEMGVSNLNSLFQRVSVTSVLEIEKLIAELQELRDYLMNEGQRVRRAIIEYAHMSQAATKSTKVVSESVSQWKRAAESSRAALRSRAPELAADSISPSRVTEAAVEPR